MRSKSVVSKELPVPITMNAINDILAILFCGNDLMHRSLLNLNTTGLYARRDYSVGHGFKTAPSGRLAESCGEKDEK